MSPGPLTRRELLIKAARSCASAALLGPSLSGCSRLGGKSIGPEDILKDGRYNRVVSGWDPIYGPPLQEFSRYGDRGDFQGHLRGGAAPGVDYDVPMDTPLVPTTTSYVRRITRDENGARYILCIDAFNPSYQVGLGHIDEVFVDEKYILSGEIMKYLGRRARVLARNELIATSGNSGWGPREYGYVQPPHLHLSLIHWNDEKKTWEDLDPEGYGIDGGRPVFWDGETSLDLRTERRILRLEKTLDEMEKEMGQWRESADLRELGGSLTEYAHRLGGIRGKKILDSAHFHDMRTLLKKKTLEERKYLPGTGPYRLMLKILGYSTDEKQKVILTLPFIPLGLEKFYQKPEYTQGTFLTIGTLHE